MRRQAQQLRRAGRFGDTELVHVNRRELQQLEAMWGRPSMNPRTGLPEFFDYSQLIAPLLGALLGGVGGGLGTGNAVGGMGGAMMGAAALPALADALGLNIPTLFGATPTPATSSSPGANGGINPTGTADDQSLGGALSGINALKPDASVGQYAQPAMPTDIGKGQGGGDWFTRNKNWAVPLGGAGLMALAGALAPSGAQPPQMANQNASHLQPSSYSRSRIGPGLMRNGEFYSYNYKRGGHVPGMGGAISPDFAQGRQVGPGDGRADAINARLSNKEYVMDAESMALLGNGDPDDGADQMDELRRNLRIHKGKAMAKGKFSPDAKSIGGYL